MSKLAGRKKGKKYPRTVVGKVSEETFAVLQEMGICVSEEIRVFLEQKAYACKDLIIDRRRRLVK